MSLKYHCNTFIYSSCHGTNLISLIADSILNKFLICFSCHHLEIQSINIFKPPTHVLSGEKASNNNLVLQAVKPHNILKNNHHFLYNIHINSAFSSCSKLSNFHKNDSTSILSFNHNQGIHILKISDPCTIKFHHISSTPITPFHTNSNINITPSPNKGYKSAILNDLFSKISFNFSEDNFQFVMYLEIINFKLSCFSLSKEVSYLSHIIFEILSKATLLTFSNSFFNTSFKSQIFQKSFIKSSDEIQFLDFIIL
jgi:hypothetical protein